MSCHNLRSPIQRAKLCSPRQSCPVSERWRGACPSPHYACDDVWWVQEPIDCPLVVVTEYHKFVGNSSSKPPGGSGGGLLSTSRVGMKGMSWVKKRSPAFFGKLRTTYQQLSKIRALVCQHKTQLIPRTREVRRKVFFRAHTH